MDNNRSTLAADVITIIILSLLLILQIFRIITLRPTSGPGGPGGGAYFTPPARQVVLIDRIAPAASIAGISIERDLRSTTLIVAM
jgi:hypothetical protein